MPNPKGQRGARPDAGVASQRPGAPAWEQGEDGLETISCVQALHQGYVGIKIHPQLPWFGFGVPDQALCVVKRKAPILFLAS